MIRKHLTLEQKATLAMRSAIRKLIKRHKHSGRPLFIWENGKVVSISADRAVKYSRLDRLCEKEAGKVKPVTAKYIASLKKRR